MLRVIILLSLMIPWVSYADNVHLDMSSFTYSEPVSVHSAVNDWHGRFFGGNKAFTYNSQELGFKYQGVTISLIRRYDYELSFSDDTAEFYYISNNKLGLEENRIYQLDLKVKNHSSRGIKASYDIQLNPQLTLTTAVAYLVGDRLTDGRLSGQARVINKSDYDFRFDFSYFYSKDVLLERKVDAPDGKGFATDIGLIWNPLESWTINVMIKDAYSEIHWRDTPITYGAATSAVKEFDKDGYVIYNPAFSGREYNDDFVQTLSPRYFGSSSVQYKRYELFAQIAVYPLQTIYSVGSQYSLGHNNVIIGSYHMPVNAISVGYQSDSFYLKITGDQIDIEESNTLGLDVGFKFEF